VCFAWLTSLVDPEEGTVRIVMFLVMVALLMVSFAIPEAFGDRGLWFAAAYGVVRLGHVVLFLVASRNDPGLRRWVIGLSIATSIVVALLVVASFVRPELKAVLWLAAIVVDWGLPAKYGADRWRLVPGHFAERHNLIIILALGESVIALGVGARVELDSTVALVGALGIGLTSALWWIYFDVVAIVTARRLEQAAPGLERNRLARDSYSYLHFPMAAGIVLSALAFEEAVPTAVNPSKLCRRWRCLAGRRSTCSPTLHYVCATPAHSTSSGWCWRSCCSDSCPLPCRSTQYGHSPS
jgi:low temperature requirement protein LtrA